MHIIARFIRIEIACNWHATEQCMRLNESIADEQNTEHSYSSLSLWFDRHVQMSGHHIDHKRVTLLFQQSM